MEKKIYIMEHLGCANCAAKMETAIQKLEGVTAATVSFMTQRLTIECEDGRLDEIVAKAEKLIRQIEPDCILMK